MSPTKQPMQQQRKTVQWCCSILLQRFLAGRNFTGIYELGIECW